jgi:hypothetical protein
MNARKIIAEIGKDPLPRQVWGNECDQNGADCVNCPARLDVERIEVRNGNIVLTLLVALAVGMAIGYMIGKLS